MCTKMDWDRRKVKGHSIYIKLYYIFPKLMAQSFIMNSCLTKGRIVAVRLHILSTAKAFKFSQQFASFSDLSPFFTNFLMPASHNIVCKDDDEFMGF